MINVAILRTSGALSLEERALSLVSDSVKEKIECTKSEEEREHRVGAYLLLSHLFGEKTKTIVYKNDVPKVDTPTPVFNYSHGDGFVALAYSECEGEKIGVDLQAEPKKKGLLSRIAERFLSPFDKIREKGDFSSIFCEYSFYEIIDGEIVKTKPLNMKRLTRAEAQCDLLSKWTILEAALKASGGGFGDYPDSEEILTHVLTETHIFEEDGKKFALTVASL